jgi:hypothetical protein
VRPTRGELDRLCQECFAPHGPAERLAILRRLSPDLAPDEIESAWPCVWPGASQHNPAGARMLRRDRARLARERPKGDGDAE